MNTHGIIPQPPRWGDQINPYGSGALRQWATPPREQRSGYANRVEVQRNEHDAVLRFYHDKGTNGTMVKEITIPLSVLDALLAAQNPTT